MIILLHAMALLNDLPRNKGLTGAFLFATTTARNSNALLGWNCGYVRGGVSLLLFTTHRVAQVFFPQ